MTAPMPPRQQCDHDGDTGLGAGHVCRCTRKPGHPLDDYSGRPHGCVCGAMWADQPTAPNPGGTAEDAADRLLRQISYEMRAHPDVAPLTPEQVAVVLHALADHTAIVAALRHRPDPTSPWPNATSMGRWFHDTADRIQERNR